MKIYLSGPMTGLPEFNKPAFNTEAARLRALGYRVENPADVELPASATWSDYMRADIPMLCQCDAVATLPGWQYSKGAKLEIAIAIELGMVPVSAGSITAPYLPAPAGLIFESPPCAHFAGAPKAAA